MSLTKNKLIQHALGLEIDGVVGPKTIAAIKELQSKNGLVVDGVAGNKTMLYVYAIIAEKEHKELNRQAFFNALKEQKLFSSFTQSQVDGINTILDVISKNTITEQAYMLATIYHECARTMQPIGEYGKGKNYVYGKWHTHNGKNACYTNGSRTKVYYQSDLDHFYYGRGYVQLTWLDNYEKAKKYIGQDFVNKPELALDPTNAAKIMLWGMTYGWFTGKKLSDYISMFDANYSEARRIINGTDKQLAIASYADKFETALRKAK